MKMKKSLLSAKEVVMLIMQTTQDNGWNRIDISNNNNSTKVIIVE